jgi:hypothetical protein
MAGKPKGYLATDRDRAEIRRAIKKLDKIHGPHVRNTRDDIYIGSPPQKPGGGGGDSGRMFKITSATQEVGLFKWRYDATEVRFTDAFTYEVIDSDNVVTLINTIEVDNTGSTSAVQSGINLATTGITAVEAVPTNTVVCCFIRRMFGSEEFWFFTYPNAPTIDCEEV